MVSVVAWESVPGRNTYDNPGSVPVPLRCIRGNGELRLRCVCIVFVLKWLSYDFCSPVAFTDDHGQKVILSLP